MHGWNVSGISGSHFFVANVNQNQLNFSPYLRVKRTIPRVPCMFLYDSAHVHHHVQLHIPLHVFLMFIASSRACLCRKETANSEIELFCVTKYIFINFMVADRIVTPVLDETFCVARLP